MKKVQFLVIFSNIKVKLGIGHLELADLMERTPYPLLSTGKGMYCFPVNVSLSCTCAAREGGGGGFLKLYHKIRDSFVLLQYLLFSKFFFFNYSNSKSILVNFIIKVSVVQELQEFSF